jgi:hypothetical protein
LQASLAVAAIQNFTAEAHDCRDAGGRVTHGAVTERTRRKTIIDANSQVNVPGIVACLKVYRHFSSALSASLR